MVNLVQITDNSFDAEVLKCDIPVLAHFSAEWSAPAKKIVPILSEVAAENEDRIKVVGLDIEDNPVVTSNYSVLNVPTLVLFKYGQEVERITAGFSKTDILAKVSPHLDR